MYYPIQPIPTPGRDTHAYADGVFTSEEINKILSLPNWLQTETAKLGGSDPSTDGRTDKNLRETDISWLCPTEETMFIWKKISDAVADVNSKFFRFDLHGCFEPIQLGIYSANVEGHYGWHTDASMKDARVPRKLSMSLILSDTSEYEGGELQLKTESDVPVTLSVPKGRAWFFPSYTLHRVTPVTKGIRRSLVIWVGGPAFK